MSAQQPRAGLAVASAALGAVAVVMAVSTWVTWAFVHPRAGDALPSPAAVVLMLVLGALWVLILVMAVLAVLFGVLGRRAAVGPARAGAAFGAVAALLALAGAVAFLVTATDWLVVVPRQR
ncbi:hypothetical protein [Amycolatopsis granulosa]|uniref:hypothetical protein n=1 Tax=Amycolatopsis granulosa TaxID=185684 RepID=UPI0014242155|nr:hypothetical protein [Amycolatopsis granulosa]NIH84617.1 small-conductance mechanosensitive channel [Amycolatopsis granulosa]